MKSKFCAAWPPTWAPPGRLCGTSDSLPRRAEAERVSGRIGIDRTAPSLRQADCAQPQRQLMRGLAVVDMDVQVELLWVRWVRPAWRLELRMLKGEHWEAAVLPRDQYPVLGVLLPPVHTQ